MRLNTEDGCAITSVWCVFVFCVLCKYVCACVFVCVCACLLCFCVSVEREGREGESEREIEREREKNAQTTPVGIEPGLQNE